ncbi:hypothetical protein CU280_09240 [Yersinia mollaretii]|nr:hypothetical protein CU280_09240 [Yersinia mollaretii]
MITLLLRELCKRECRYVSAHARKISMEMNMKKILLNSFAMAFLATTTQINAATPIYGGTINFTGNAVNAACAVSAKSSNQTIDMGQVRLAELDGGANKLSSAKTAFTIILDQCDTNVASQVGVLFTGSVANANQEVLAAGMGATSTAATGIGIQITDPNGDTVKFDGSANSNFTLIGVTNVLTYFAQFISTATTVTDGNTNATMTFSVTYT